MTFEDTWNDFVGGKIDYQNFSDHGWVMAVNAAAETYDVVIGEKELLDNGEVDPAKIYRGIKSTVPFSVVQYGVGSAVLVGYLNGDRNHPLVIGASDNIVMDVTKVTVNPVVNSNLWITDQFNYRFKKHSGDSLQFLDEAGSIGTGNGQFNSPAGIASDGTHVFVVDSINKNISKFLAGDLSFVSNATRTPADDPSSYLVVPLGVCVDDTYLYICNANRHTIQKWLKTDLTYIGQTGIFNSPGSSPTRFDYPSGIATDGTYLYVANGGLMVGNHDIVKLLASDLSYVTNASFSGLNGIAIDTNNIYGLSSQSVQVYNHDLVQISAWTTLTPGGITSNLSHGISSDGTHVYLGENIEGVLKKFTADGIYVAQFGSLGSGVNEFNGINFIHASGNYNLFF